MTQSGREVIDFDAVKDEYVKGLDLKDVPKSNDALFDEGNGCFTFVEFKNGLIDKKEQFSIRKKIYDSVLIFTDITKTDLSFMRDHMKYILVYNETVNQNNSEDKVLKEKQKSKVQNSVSYDQLAKSVLKYSNQEYICFGLNIFKNYCFKEVHTYDQEEFKWYPSNL